MGLLQRLGDDVAARHGEELALEAVVGRLGHHLRDLAGGLFPHGLLQAAFDAEAAELLFGGGFARAELDAAVGEEVEGGDALGDACGVVVVGRGEGDAVAEAHVLRALREGGEHELGRGGVRVLLEEVVLDFEDVIEAEFIGELHLVEHLVVDAVLGVRGPTARRRRAGEAGVRRRVRISLRVTSAPLVVRAVCGAGEGCQGRWRAGGGGRWGR